MQHFPFSTLLLHSPCSVPTASIPILTHVMAAATGAVVQNAATLITTSTSTTTTTTTIAAVAIAAAITTITTPPIAAAAAVANADADADAWAATSTSIPSLTAETCRRTCRKWRGHLLAATGCPWISGCRWRLLSECSRLRSWHCFAAITCTDDTP